MTSHAHTSLRERLLLLLLSLLFLAFFFFFTFGASFSETSSSSSSGGHKINLCKLTVVIMKSFHYINTVITLVQTGSPGPWG